MCRAISTATGLKYDSIDVLLRITAEIHSCEKLCVCCYHYLLDDVFQYKRKECDFTKTVEEIVLEHPTETLILRVDSHLTSSVNGKVLDIWDCTGELVDCYWIVD